MKRAFSTGFAVLVCAQLLGCVQTTVRSVRDPGYTGKQYSRLLVHALEEFSYERAALIEDTYEAKLRRAGFEGAVFKYTTLFPPTRNVRPTDVDHGFVQHGIEAALEVKSVSSGFNKSYVPRSTSTTSESQLKKNKGVTTVETRTVTTESGGYTVANPWERFEVRLVDRATKGVAWMAFTTTHGNAGSGFAGLIDSQAASVAKKLMEDDVLTDKNATDPPDSTRSLSRVPFEGMGRAASWGLSHPRTSGFLLARARW